MGGLEIYGTQLADLDGLENLTAAPDGIRLSWNEALASVDALVSVRAARSLRISANPLLTSLSPLGQIENLTELLVDYQHLITTLDVFASTDSLAFLSVTQCAELRDVPLNRFRPSMS